MAINRKGLGIVFVSCLGLFFFPCETLNLFSKDNIFKCGVIYTENVSKPGGQNKDYGSKRTRT